MLKPLGKHDAGCAPSVTGIEEFVALRKVLGLQLPSA